MKDTAIQQYEERGGQLLTEARAIVIVDDTTREIATEFSSNARKAIKIIEDDLRPDIEKAHHLHRDLLARLKRVSAPFREAQRIVDSEIGRDFMEREKVRREEERKVQEKADREREDQEAEWEGELKQLVDGDKMEEAEALFDAEIVVAPTIPVATVDKTTRSDAGSVTAHTDIKVELMDKRTVIQLVHIRNLPDTFLDVNVGVAKRYAKASGLKSIPGFRITETAVISGRIK